MRWRACTGHSDQLDDRAGKQRSVVLLDLAAAHAATDAEHGMDFAMQAFDQLEREPYGTAYGRIPELSTLCMPSRSTPTAAVYCWT